MVAPSNDYKKYLEEKFKGMNEQFDALNAKIDDALDRNDKKVEELDTEVKWLNQKVWMAIGALAIIAAVGGILAAYFKVLNKVQVQEAAQAAVKQALGEYNIKIQSY